VVCRIEVRTAPWGHHHSAAKRDCGGFYRDPNSCPLLAPPTALADFCTSKVRNSNYPAAPKGSHGKAPLAVMAPIPNPTAPGEMLPGYTQLKRQAGHSCFRTLTWDCNDK